MIGANFFPQVIGQFNKAYPNIKVQLWESGAKRAEDNVENGNLEIGVTLLPVQEELFQWFSFVKDKLNVVVHPSHRLAGNVSISLSELAAEEFILFNEDFLLHDRIIAECVRVGFQPQVVYESSQWDFISEMVAADLGVALLPGTICSQLDKQRLSVLSLIQPEIPWHLAVIWRKNRYLSFAAREWLQFTRKLLQANK
jgi:DNA-binding transcriptional LysR family regulator